MNTWGAGVQPCQGSILRKHKVTVTEEYKSSVQKERQRPPTLQQMTTARQVGVGHCPSRWVWSTMCVGGAVHPGRCVGSTGEGNLSW